MTQKQYRARVNAAAGTDIASSDATVRMYDDLAAHYERLLRDPFIGRRDRAEYERRAARARDLRDRALAARRSR